MASEPRIQTTTVPMDNGDNQAEKKLTSRYRGVCWNKKNKRWQSAINRAGRYIYLGSFTDEYGAAVAFDKAAVKLRGHAAKINFSFADYPAEMNWHNQMSQLGDATEMVLNNPRLLRETTAQGHHPVAGSYLAPLPFRLSQPCNNTMYSFTRDSSVDNKMGVIHQQAPMYKPAGTMYMNVHPYDRRQMMPSYFGNGDGEMLSPTSGLQYPHPQFNLSDPAVKAEPYSMPPTSNDTYLPVVNMPDGAELTHLFRGPQNAFAMGFKRQETTATEVLLYDGRSMHEVGSFTSKDDAAQTCRSLLKILDSVRSTENSVNTPGVQQPVNTSAVQVHQQLDGAMEDSYANPKGVSPFKIPVGSTPFPCTANQESAPGREEKTLGNSSQPKDDLQNRMGSLLHIDPSLSVSNLEDLSPTLQTDKECRNEPSTKIFSSLSLINSGSLKNLLAVFNQSGNFSIIRKEDTDEPVQGFNCVDIPIPSQQDDPPSVGTPKLQTERSTPFVVEPSKETLYPGDRMGDKLTSSPSTKRKAVEWTNDQAKKPRETALA